MPTHPQQTSTYRRPDRALALKRAYEAWFTEQIEAALRDPSPALDDDDVEKVFAARRAELHAQKR